MSENTRKGIAIGALAGLVAVAAAGALTAAAPAPAPANAAGSVIPKVIATVKSTVEESSQEAPAIGDEDAEATAASDENALSGAIPDAGADGDGSTSETQDIQQSPKQSESTAAATSDRHWVVDYATVWVPKVETVVDAPERVEAVYETRDMLVCNACGYQTESSSGMGSHLSAHAVKGVDEGYSSISQKVQVGTTTIPPVTHEVDNGHYEKVASGGHWE